MATTAGHRLTLDPMGKCSNAFFSETQRLLCPSMTNIDLGATFPGANMVQGQNTLGYLRTRTFYTPERKYAYKYASITKCLTYSPREM